MISTAIGVATLLGLLGTAYIKAGDPPPWSGRERVVQLEQSFLRVRYSQILADIGRLLDTQSHRRLTPDEQRWLDSLLIERQQLACQLRLEVCR